MKKVFVFVIFIFALISFCGCINNGYGEPVVSVLKEIPQEKNEEKSDEWELFKKEISKEGISAEEAENLLDFGYKKEEIMEMEPWKIKRGTEALKLGIDKNKIALADELTENPEIAENDKQFMLCGLYRTVRSEYAENFISAVQKGEACSIAGIMVGYTMPYFFEISYEPGGSIEIINIWRDMLRFAEITAVYETESFYYFEGENGESFSIIKEKAAAKERTIDENYVPGTDIPGMPVSAKEAEKAAEKLFAISLTNPQTSKETGAMRLLGSWGTAEKEEYYEEGKTLMGKEYEAKAEGACTIGEKTFYTVKVYYQGMDIGYVCCIGAEDSSFAYSIGMTNGETVPVEYIDEPVVKIEKE